LTFIQEILHSHLIQFNHHTRSYDMSELMPLPTEADLTCAKEFAKAYADEGRVLAMQDQLKRAKSYAHTLGVELNQTEINTIQITGLTNGVSGALKSGKILASRALVGPCQEQLRNARDYVGQLAELLTERGDQAEGIQAMLERTETEIQSTEKTGLENGFFKAASDNGFFAASDELFGPQEIVQSQGTFMANLHRMRDYATQLNTTVVGLIGKEGMANVLQMAQAIYGIDANRYLKLNFKIKVGPGGSMSAPQPR